MSILDHSGTVIYDQKLGKTNIEQSTIDKIITVTLGFKNTMDLILSSVNFERFTLHFRQGANFLIAILSNRSIACDTLIDQLLMDFVKNDVMRPFIEAAHLHKKFHNKQIEQSIRRIMYNLDFITSMLQMKQRLRQTAPRF